MTATAAETTSEKRLDVNLRSGPQVREYEAIVRRIAADRPGAILDWGAGWGQMTHLLRQAGLDVIGFDYRPETEGVITEPLERFPDVEVTLSGDPRRLPFDDESFDSALSCGVLEHVEDPDASLDELRRVLRPGGTLYVYKLPNRFSYLEAIARTFGMWHHGSDPYDRLYTLRSARQIVGAHGFEVRSSRRANMLPLTTVRAGGLTAPVWAVNRALSRVPVLNLLATNVELVATKPGQSSPG